MKNEVKSVFLKPGKERAVINRHPWIFSGAIARADQGLSVKDQVIIKDHTGKPLALGHWCGSDGLVCRIFSFDPACVVDEAFWANRFYRAKLLRQTFGLPNASTNAYRLLHGEGDGLSGLVCDIFRKSASIQSTNPGFTSIIPLLTSFLVDECGIENIFLADSCAEQNAWILGPSDDGEFLENNLVFLPDIGHGQKTGHFLDQRDNRALVKSYAKGRDVLDAFCYSGGFSTYALSGGAHTVTSVDISEVAIHLCEKNVSKNGFGDAHRAVVADCFTYLRQIKKDDFDLIILDPPAFAKSAQAVTRAARGYKDINLLALKAVRGRGMVFTFSCSQHIDVDLFKKIIFAAAKDSAREVKIIGELTQGADHPVSVYCPQSSYLKGLALYVE